MYLSDLMAAVQGFGFTVLLWGIPFFISGWTLVIAVVFWLDARLYIAHQMRDYPRSNYTVAAIGAALTVLASIGVHEASHSIVAWYSGLTTTNGGMSWWGAHVVLNKPLNEIHFLNEMAIAGAGPLSNLLLAFAAALVVRGLGESRFENAVQYTAAVNYRLFVFNLLPVVGLDGSKVLDGVLRPFLGKEIISLVLLVTTILSLRWFLKSRREKKLSAFEKYLEAA